jgi:hypothetical protein
MLKRLLHHSKKENRAGMNILIANCLFILVAGSINKTFAESGFQTPKDADTSRSSRVLVEKFTSAGFDDVARPLERGYAGNKSEPKKVIRENRGDGNQIRIRFQVDSGPHDGICSRVGPLPD